MANQSRRPLFSTMLTSKLPLVSLFSTFLLSTASPISRLGPSTASNAPIIFDGRVPTNFSESAFDSSATSPFNPDFVRAADEPFSQIIKFPDVSPSLLDGRTSRPIEVTINDNSIFAPGGNPQNGFRRAELLPITNNGTDATVQGITTLHFSIQEDPTKSLNYTHEYQPVFIETNDFASHVWTLKTGTPFGTNPASMPESEAKTLRLGSSTAGGAEEVVLFEVPFDTGVWYNFAIQTDWDKRYVVTDRSLWILANLYCVAQSRHSFRPTTSHSRKWSLLVPIILLGKDKVCLSHFVSGTLNILILAHFGVLKLPTLPSTNPSQDGIQEVGIDEGLIYGGIFIEDTSENPPTLKPC